VSGEVKYLGILIDSSLKFNSHIDSIVAKAHLRASLKHKCFVSKHPALLTGAFKVYVRPIVEYASCVWSPHYGYAIDKVELVQRRFTKRLPGFHDMEYSARLDKLNLQSLEYRRVADLILTYKIIFGLTGIDLNVYFRLKGPEI